MEPILEVRNIYYTYSAGTPFEHRALENVSFRLSRGEFLGVIGHTGSGKSTLMQQMNGLLKPTSGQVLLDGTDIWSDKKFTRQARFRVGLVFQYPEYQLFEETVYQDIAYGPKNMGLDEKEIDRRVKSVAELVGISESQLKSSPFDLSGGQKRRAAIAGVMAMEPEVLILDEPTAGLDPIGRKEILDQIQRYRDTHNAAIVMVSHSMEDVARLTDRLLVLCGSRLVMDGTSAEIFTHAQELVEMGLSIPAVTQVFLRLQKLGLDVPSVYTLEQAEKVLLELKEGRHHA